MRHNMRYAVVITPHECTVYPQRLTTFITPCPPLHNNVKRQLKLQKYISTNIIKIIEDLKNISKNGSMEKLQN